MRKSLFLITGAVALLLVLVIALVDWGGTESETFVSQTYAESVDKRVTGTLVGDLASPERSPLFQEGPGISGMTGEGDLAPVDVANPCTASIQVSRFIGDRAISVMPGVRVLLSSRNHESLGEVLLGTTDENGLLKAVLPGDGHYVFKIDPASIPKGAQRPGQFKTAGKSIPGVTSSRVRLAPGEHRNVVIGVQEARSLSGLVLGPLGDPVPQATLQAKCTSPGFQSVVHNAVTDEFGAFIISEMYPLKYALRLRLVGEEGGAFPGGLSTDGHSYPPPLFFDLEEADIYDVVVRLAKGDLSVVGRVVDEDGAPFSNLSVLAYYATPDGVDSESAEGQYRYTWSDRAGSAETGPDGFFRFNGLQRASLSIQVAPNAAVNGGRGTRLITRTPESIRISPVTHGAGEFNIGDVAVQRSRTYSVSGTVVLTSERADGKRLKLSKLIVEGAFPKTPGILTRSGQHRPFTEYDRRTGTFSVSCDTPCESMMIRIYRRGEVELAKEFFFSPTPDLAESDITLEYP